MVCIRRRLFRHRFVPWPPDHWPLKFCARPPLPAIGASPEVQALVVQTLAVQSVVVRVR